MPVGAGLVSRQPWQQQAAGAAVPVPGQRLRSAVPAAGALPSRVPGAPGAGTDACLVLRFPEGRLDG